ncbi:MAG: hypothetical protein PHI27_05460 [Eubacteriales bacterium]|nr:hypothetical protein [Eubacteriales bacterium]MDD3881682.1 hypothetical protein [Eubacteriales bacterium]MDD4512259.1 hypothetical protein [Eubacteriales bacterium]
MSETNNTGAPENIGQSAEKQKKTMLIKRIIYCLIALIGAAAGILLRDRVYESVIYAAIAMACWLVSGVGLALLRKYVANAYIRQALLILAVVCLIELALIAYFLIQTAGWQSSPTIF